MVCVFERKPNLLPTYTVYLPKPLSEVFPSILHFGELPVFNNVYSIFILEGVSG